MQYKKIDIDPAYRVHQQRRENALWVMFLSSMGLALLVTYCL